MTDTGTLDDATSTFDEHRRLLIGVAYRVLGQWSEAEDVVQDAWLRWRDVEHDEIENPRSYLVRVTTRLSIDRLRRAKARRETYVGEWLPEPVLTDQHTLAVPDVADQVAQSDSVSLAMLVVLETLSPLERAVFVLRDVFDFQYDEIGTILDRSETAIRQLASRARSHVEAGKPRFDADQQVQREVTEKFLLATKTGRFEELLELLSPEVELHSDGGGLVRAPRRVIVGAEKVSRFFASIADRGPENPIVYLANVNGRLAVVVDADGEPNTVLSIDIRDGRIVTVHLIASPEKLTGVRDVDEVGTRVDIAGW